MINLMAMIDGSKYSQSVCDHAAWFANISNGTVEIMHVIGRDNVSSEPENLSGSIGLGARTTLLEELAELDEQRARLAQKRGRAILEDAKMRVIAAGVENVTTRLRLGEIVEAIVDFEAAADMIVIGKRGQAANFDMLHLGSNLERVLRSSHRPVLVASRAFKPIQRFLIAFDGGPSVLKAITLIAQNKLFSNLKCELLSVGQVTAESTRQLEDAAALLSEAGYDVQIKQEQGQPEAVISREVETNNYDLLVMGAFGHSRIRQLIIGSTTTEMIRSCKIPVLLFR
jgi:nucleotide-binding universal stress UspA family protein